MQTFQDTETTVEKHPEYDSYIMEEDDLDELDGISGEISGATTVLSKTCLSTDSIEDDEDKQSTSSAINIRSQVPFLGKLIIGL